MNYTEEYVEQLEKIMASLRVELRREKRKIEKLQERVAEGDKLIAALKASISEIAAPVGKLAVRTDSLTTFFKLTDEELAALAPAPAKPKQEPAPMPEIMPKPSSEESFAIDNGVIYKYVGKNSKIVIPDSVRSIGKWAFYGCKSLTSITIPESVTSIGDWAFSSCTSLTEITIPESVKSFGHNAFENCYKLTVKCKAGSYAERYCRINNIRYITTV